MCYSRFVIDKISFLNQAINGSSDSKNVQFMDFPSNRADFPSFDNKMSKLDP